MGASPSNLTESSVLADGVRTELGDIPESCVARVFLHLTPPEICNFARLNRAFRGAASSDSVWEAKLPHKYQDLIDLVAPETYRNLSKKDIFALLSRPLPFDDGNKQIWWFEVDGTVKFPFPADIYTLSFRIHLGRFSKRYRRRVCDFEHTHGWDLKPVRFEFLTSDGQLALSECCLDGTEHGNANVTYKRGCWIEYKVGQFIVTGSVPTTEVRFSMKQIDCTHSKGGICVDSVSIFPCNLNDDHI